MQIKKRLQINVAVSVLVALVICLVLLLSLYRLNKANNSAKISDEIVSSVLERVTFRNDYIRNNTARAKEQWFIKHAQIGGLLKAASENFQGAEDRANITALLEDHESIGNIFRAIASNREKRGLHPSSADLSREVEDRLLSQLNMRVYEVVLHSRKLLESSREARDSALRLAGSGIISVLLILIVAALFNSRAMGRAITDRVQRLREGATVIGAGNLDHRIDVKGDDEFADLSNAFNAMAAKLRLSYRDLESEIDLRKRAEKALLVSRRDLDRAQEVGQIGSWRLDVRRNVLTWSDENHRIFGVTKGTPMTYETFLGIVHPDDRQFVDAQWKAGLAGAHYDIEHRLVVDGKVKWVREKAYLEFDEAGELLGGFGTTQDITELKQAQEMLIALNKDLENRIFQRTRFYSVLAAVNAAIVRQHDQQTLFNEVCRIIVEIGGFKLAWVGLVDPATREVRPAASSGATGYLKGIRIIASDVPEGRGPTGTAIVEGRHSTNLDFEKEEKMKLWRERAREHGIRSSSAFPLRTGDQVIGALTIYSDQPRFFTVDEVALLLSLSENLSFAIAAFEVEKKRLAAVNALKTLNEDLELRVARRTAELEFSNRELEAFIYSVSHDLRAPLRHISGFSRIIAEDYADKFDEQGKDHLARIHNGAERMAQLIDDLLRLSRISRQDMAREEVDMSAMTAALVAEFREADPDRNREVTIKQQISASADRRLIKLALQNLIDNAWKFTSKTQDARIEFDAFEQEGTIVYRLRDNGVGFDPAYAGKMFLPFHRLHTESEFEGSGIGLTIVERVIHRHGGRIWAEGEPGKGATIYFTLD
jgi:PAS domain S-box-containing protein